MPAIPRAVPRTIWVPGASFGLTVGSPAVATLASRWRYMAYDDTASEIASAVVPLPAFWVTMDVDLYWSVAGTPGAGADTVRWVTNLDRAGDGETLNASGGGGSAITDLVAPAQFVLKVSRVFTARPVDATKLLNLRVQRDGANAADTLVGDAALLGVRLRRGQASTTVDL